MLKNASDNSLFFKIITLAHSSDAISIALIFVLFTQSIFAKPILQKIEIGSLNNIICSFEQIPKYSIKLDSTKTNLTIEFKNTFISNQVSSIENQRIVQLINFSTNHSNLIFNIKLKEKSGYSSLIEPYSQRIIINLFNWSNLSKNEDLFHTGLLALEDTLYNTAEKYLYESTMLGNTKSAAILSMIYANQKKINRATKFSALGKYEAMYFPDINNILANIYKYKSDSINFLKYKNEFEKQTSKKLFPIFFSSNIPSDTLSNIENHILDSLIYFYQSQIQSNTANSDFSRFNKLFDSNYNEQADSSSKQSSSWNALPLWLKAIIGVIAAFLIVLIFQYFRWRNMQIKMKQSKQKEQAKQSNLKKTSPEVNEKKSPTVPPQILDAYLQNQPTTKESIPTENQTSSPQPQESLEITEEKVKQLSNILENIKSTKEEESQRKSKLTQPPLSAKLELALNLAEEQKRIKQNKIEMSQNDLSSSSDKLKSTAKKLGLEENTIEIKQAIENLINDKSKLAELQSKFDAHSQKK
jgi:hypothetical protein